VTGIPSSEKRLRLNRGDVDLKTGTVAILAAKFNKSRERLAEDVTPP